MGFAVFCRKLRRNPPLEVGAADEVRQQLHDMGRYNLLDEDALNDWAVGALYASDPSKVARFALPGFMIEKFEDRHPHFALEDAVS